MSTRSERLFRRAQGVLAGGVSRNTLLRDPHPIYVERGEGCRVVDVDGAERIDFANNMAALIHGHAHPTVVSALIDQLRRGSAFTLATEVELEYAGHLCGRCPSFERIRFVNSGTEAVMSAIKAARAATGRTRIAKAEGTYHGSYDYAEVSQAPKPDTWGRADHPASVPLAAGTPLSVPEDVVVLPYNDSATCAAILDRHRGEIAAVILDLMPHRLGLVQAKSDFVEMLRDWTRADGALLILDEVVTFRTETGGMQERYGLRPDLTALGKIIGGGMPVGALAGRAEVMEVFTSHNGAPPRMPHSGTFSANPMTMTAGLTSMKLFDAEAVSRLNRLGDLARQRIREAIAVSGAPASVTGAGSMLRIHLRAEAPRDYRSGFPSPGEAAALARFVNAIYENGVVLIHTGTASLSTPMREIEIDALAEAVLAGLRAVREHLAPT
ncbi:MAG: aspartate aminotransferase family protein [Thermoanaerobaculia bacterium]